MGTSIEAPDPPDYSEVTKKQLKFSKRQFDWQKEQYKWAQDQYKEDRAVANQVIDQALEINKRNAEWAAEDRERYTSMFQPLEEDLIKEAKEYASPERVEYEMGRAQAGVAQNFDMQRAQAQQALESYGIDPGQARYQALDVGMRTAQGAEMAGAANMARDKTEAMGRAMRSEAINIGKGYPGQIAGTYGTALAAGNQGVNAGLATTASGANTMGTPQQYGQIGMGGLNNAGSLMSNMYGNQIAAFNAEQQASSGLGSMFGAGLGLASKFMGFGFEDGGEVPDDEMQGAIPEGGPVGPHLSPSRGQEVDDVPAWLNAGEFVIPREVVEYKGEEFFHKLISNTKKQREMAIADSGAEPGTKTAIPDAPTYVSGGMR
jgi:hypothetical protein